MEGIDCHKSYQRQSKSGEMMRPKVTEFQREHELFRTELINLVNQRHGLVKLADNICYRRPKTEPLIDVMPIQN